MRIIHPPSSLKGSHLRTYEKIFQHPISRNLPWRDVLALLNTLGEIVIEPNGNLKVTRNGHVVVLPPPQTKDVAEVDELMKLRHFLEQSETAPPQPDQPLGLILVVIDQHKARLFRTEMHNDAPKLILHYEPDDYFRHAHDSRDYFDGKQKPAPSDYFEPVAKALKNASQILVFGPGTGASSEGAQFTDWLKKHHPELAARITDTLPIDEHHLTDSQILAKAREVSKSV